MNFNINLVSRDNRKNFSLIFDETNNVNDFLSIFSVDKDSQEIFIGPYVWSFKVSTKLNEFVEKWQDQIPQLKGILAFFDKLCEGETFFMFPNLPIERQQQQLNIELAIKDHYENISPQAMQCVSNKIGNRLETYHMYSIGDERMVLGTNADKCRFCKKTASEHEATFKKEAHAIPEGLGNKTVKSKDECDICNDKFSETIEPDLIKYLSFYRTIWEIKGKGGEKEIKENNFLFSKKALDGENLEAVKKVLDENEVEELQSNPIPQLTIIGKIEDGENKEAILEFGNLNKQNIYRALCKSYIAALPDNLLPNFVETLKWIQGYKSINSSLFISEYNTKNFYEQPIMRSYIRKDNNNSMPYAFGEFYFGHLILVFIVPETGKDKINYSNKNEFIKFLKSKEIFDLLGEPERLDDCLSDIKQIYSCNICMDDETKGIYFVD